MSQSTYDLLWFLILAGLVALPALGVLAWIERPKRPPPPGKSIRFR